MKDKEKLRAFAKEFGAVIRRARIIADLTQEELAEEVQTTRAAIIRIELGQATYMPASRALEICAVLDTSLTQIWKNLNTSESKKHETK